MMGSKYPDKLPAHTKGNPKVPLVSNSFEVSLGDKIIHVYDVSIIQDCESRGRKKVIDWSTSSGDSAKRRIKLAVSKEIFKKALEVKKFASKEAALVFDFSKILFSSEKLKDHLCSAIILTPEDFDVLPSFEGNSKLCRGTYTVRIVPTKAGSHQFRANDLEKALAKNQEDHSLRQFLEVATSFKPIQEGTHKFFRGILHDVRTSAPGRRDLQNGPFEIAYGISKGARIIGDMDNPKAALVMDSKRFAVYSESKETFLEDIQKVLGDKDLKIHLPRITKMFQGVTLGHCFNKAVEVKFSSLSNVLAEKLTFENSDGQKSFIVDYLEERYENYQCRARRWPVVVDKFPGRSGDVCYYPLDILYVKEGQLVPLPLQQEFGITQELLKEVSKPHLRSAEIGRAPKDLELNARNAHLREHGINVKQAPIKLEGYRAQPPKLGYANGQTAAVDANRANWEAGRYIYPAKVDSFRYFVRQGCMGRDQANLFLNKFLDMCRSKGLDMPKPQIEFIKGPLALKNLLSAEDKAKSKTHDALKFYEAKYQILTQQVRSETTFKAGRQTMENIVAKTNEKCFGQNYAIHGDEFISTKDTLILAYDVWHPTGASAQKRILDIPDDTPSVVGMSFNGGVHADGFIGFYAYQEPLQERVDVLKSYMQHILRIFKKTRGLLPKNIVIIRDGVSEGQFDMVCQHELASIRAGCRQFANAEKVDWNPKFMVVTVTKRHDKRFFVQDGHRVLNPPPGTVVDCTVTRPDMTEIFLQPHRPFQGSAKAAAYSLLVNELEIPKQKSGSDLWLTNFLMKLCYSHQIAPSSISIPEPVKQADEWAKRGAANLEFLKRENGDKSLDMHNFLKSSSEGSFYDWAALSDALGYHTKRLEGTRANA